MADLTGVTTNYIPTAHETFEDTLSASCLAGAATVFITNLGEYNDGDVVVLTVDPGTANEATFTGVKQSAPYRVTDVKWTEGNTAVGHNSGATVIDYDSATHYNMITKLLKLVLNQDGTLITSAVQAALGLGADALNGWNALGYAPNSVVDNGNGSYTATFNSVDLTSITGIGDKMLLPRAATATQCATFDGVNDYFSKATPNKMTWTDDWTGSAWIKPAANAGAGSALTIFSRYNGTSGFRFDIEEQGRIRLLGHNAGAGNVSFVSSSRSVIVNRWQHVAGLLDMSAFTAASGTAETAKSWIMINGVEVPAFVSRSGTNPTTLVQAGNWEVGANNTGTMLFNGKMAQVAVYNTRVLQATIRASRNQPLTGSETNLATAHSFNNSILDLNTTTPNDLTANGGVVATTNETPFTSPVTGTNLTAGTRNYATILAQTFSTNTVYTLQVLENETIPTTTPPTSVSYSKQKSPYGYPFSHETYTTELYNPCKFSVYLNANQTGVTDATITKILFDSAWFDTGNNVDLSTNKGRFTAPVTGFYQIQAVIGVNPASGSVGVSGLLSIYKNNSEIRRVDLGYPSTGNTAGVFGGAFSEILQLQAGDYIEVAGYADVTAGNVTFRGGLTGSVFSGYLVSVL